MQLVTILYFTYAFFKHSTMDLETRGVVIAVLAMKMVAFWDTAPCSLVEVHRRFRRAY
jgi:hypothetical protein